MATSETSEAIPARPAFGRRGLVLGIVSLSSPLALNMYVPAFPRIAADLGTDPAAIQLSLTSFLIALAVGQNVYGPLSDRFGRKKPLYAGLGLFFAASIAVAFAPSLEWLVACRLAQGFGACAAMAIPRAVIRDLHSGAEAARLLAMVVLVVSIAPLLAPLAGSALASAWSWRAIFAFMAATSLFTILLVALLLPETLPPARRTTHGLGGMVRAYGALLRDRHFVGLTLMMALGQGAFFAFLGGSPVVFMTHFGWSDWDYGLMFGMTAAFWAGAVQLAPGAIARFGANMVLKGAAVVNSVALIALFAIGRAGLDGPWAIVLGILPFYLATGILVPTATVAALHLHGRMAGTASALIGTTGFATGAAASALVSALADGSAAPMLGVMALCGLLGAGAAWLAFSGDDHFDEAGAQSGEGLDQRVI